MISAERFARERGSYWAQLLPRLEAVVRAVNLGVGRFSPPIASGVQHERRAFVAELAFELFKIRLRDKRISATAESEAIQYVRQRIAVLGPYPEQQIHDPTLTERKEAVRLRRNLAVFVRERSPVDVIVSPSVPGCGIIDRCAADLLIEGYERQRIVSGPGGPSWATTRVVRLYEVKAVERSFRATDFRQLIVYAALMAARQDTPDILGLVNPRLGTYFECGIDELTMDTAGVPADELLQRIIFDVSAAEISL